MTHDPDCICHGNWRLLIKEVGHLIGRTYRNEEGQEFVFFGLVHGDDDYYYGMCPTPWGTGGVQLLSCVGNIEMFGYQLVEAHGTEEEEPGRAA